VTTDWRHRMAPPLAPATSARTVVVIDSASGPVLSGTPEEHRTSGVDAISCIDPLDALLVASRSPGAVILAPVDLHGMTLARLVELASALTSAPVIVGLPTASPDTGEAVSALDLGARSIMALPAAPQPLARAVSSMPWKVDATLGSVCCGALCIDAAAHVAAVGDTPVALSPKEFAILHHLVAQSPRVVPLEELLSVFESGEQQYASRMRVMVGKVRHKLDAVSGAAHATVETVRGVGYRVSG
jgi:DNA-binding response OmpR family regulator